MKTVSTFRAILGAMLLTGAVVAACSNHGKTQDTAMAPPPLGQSTAEGPANSNVPPPDSAGVPSPDQPARQESPPNTMITHRGGMRTAQIQASAGDAGVVPSPTGPVGIRSDGGVGGPGAGRDSGIVVPPGRGGDAGIGGGNGITGATDGGR